MIEILIYLKPSKRNGAALIKKKGKTLIEWNT
jgi:hypothetical protein